jgi:hypothetical protein
MRLEIGPDLFQGSAEQPGLFGRLGSRVGGRLVQVGDGQELRLGVAAALRLRMLVAPAEMIADLVARDGPQPTAEAIPGPLVAKAADRGRDRLEDLLNDLGSVVGLETGVAAPAVDQRSVQLDQLPPRIPVLSFHALQKAQAGGLRSAGSDAVHAWRD